MLLTIYVIGVFVCFLGLLSIYVASKQWEQYDGEDGAKEAITDVLAFVLGCMLSWALPLTAGVAWLFYYLREYIHKRKI